MIKGLKVGIIVAAVVFGMIACNTTQRSMRDVPVVNGVVHTVGEGETLSAIAKTYEVSTQLLIRRNNLRQGDTLKPGSRLFIPGATELRVVQADQSDSTIREEKDGLLYTVGPGETLIAIANAYAMYDVTVEELQRVNNIPDASKIYVGEELWIPRAKEVKDVNLPKTVIVTATPLTKKNGKDKDPRVTEKLEPTPTPTRSSSSNKPNANDKTAASTLPKDQTPTPTPVEFPRTVKEYGPERFQWPLKGSFQVLRSYSKTPGNFNPGIDLGAGIGTDVCAAADGEVQMVGGVADSLGAGFGNHIIIYHGEKNNHEYYTLYAHNSQNLVKIGEKVKRGQAIAKVGNTGRPVSAPAGVLHFEVREDFGTVDPLKVLPPIN